MNFRLILVLLIALSGLFFLASCNTYPSWAKQKAAVFNTLDDATSPATGKSTGSACYDSGCSMDMK